MRRFFSILSIALVAATGARAAMLEIDLPFADAVETRAASYTCPDQSFDVTYYNAGENALAVLAFEDRSVVMVNVLSASGAKYAGGTLVWWTKCDQGDLYDVSQEDDADPVSCTVRE